MEGESEVGRDSKVSPKRAIWKRERERRERREREREIERHRENQFRDNEDISTLIKSNNVNHGASSLLYAQMNTRVPCVCPLHRLCMFLPSLTPPPSLVFFG